MKLLTDFIWVNSRPTYISCPLVFLKKLLFFFIVFFSSYLFILFFVLFLVFTLSCSLMTEYKLWRELKMCGCGECRNDCCFLCVCAGYQFSNTACCGEGPWKGLPCINPVSDVCANANDYVFWDLFHPSQQTYQYLANGVISGDSSIMHPTNLNGILWPVYLTLSHDSSTFTIQCALHIPCLGLDHKCLSPTAPQLPPQCGISLGYHNCYHSHWFANHGTPHGTLWRGSVSSAF